MTQFNPVTLSAEDVNNVELSAADAHKITLSVIDWFYVQILNAIIAQAAVKLGATALCSVLSKINAESAVVLGATGSLTAPARIIGSAGMALGGTAEAEVSVTARIIALASVVLGAEAVMSTVSKIVGTAGVGLGGTANVVVPSNINGAAGVSVGASGVAVVRSLLVAQSGVSFGAQVAARCPAIIIGTAGMGLGASAELDAGAVIWTPEQFDSSVLKLWLDAMPDADGNFRGHKDASGYVDEWYDRSGNGNHIYQSTGNLQSIYNPNKVIFDGIDDCMDASGYSPYGNMTVYFVVANKRASIPANSGDVLLTIDSGENQSTGFRIMTSNTWETGSSRRISCNAYGSPVSIYANGYSTAQTFAQNEAFIGAVLMNPTSTGLNLRINKSCAPNEWFPGNHDVYEIAIVNRQDNATDRQKMEGYFAHKWGLTSKLPSDHPYKTNPPTV